MIVLLNNRPVCPVVSIPSVHNQIDASPSLLHARPDDVIHDEGAKQEAMTASGEKYEQSCERNNNLRSHFPLELKLSRNMQQRPHWPASRERLKAFLKRKSLAPCVVG